MPASTMESGTAGPAYSAAATPVSTKIPAPMIAPTPSAVRWSGPRVRLSERSDSTSASARSTAMDLVANRVMPPICAFPGHGRTALGRVGSTGGQAGSGSGAARAATQSCRRSGFREGASELAARPLAGKPAGVVHLRFSGERPSSGFSRELRDRAQQLVTIASAQGDAGAALEDHDRIAMEPRLHFPHPVEVDERRPAGAAEPLGIEPHGKRRE